MSYQDEQAEWVKKTKLKVGDIVRVVGKPDKWAYSSWNPEMDRMLKSYTCYTVQSICSFGIELRDVNLSRSYFFPYNSLAFVRKKEDQKELTSGIMYPTSSKFSLCYEYKPQNSSLSIKQKAGEVVKNQAKYWITEPFTVIIKKVFSSVRWIVAGLILSGIVGSGIYVSANPDVLPKMLPKITVELPEILE